MDLSLNYNTVHFIEHSNFLDLTGLQANYLDIFGSSTGADSEFREGETMNEDKVVRDEKLLS